MQQLSYSKSSDWPLADQQPESANTAAEITNSRESIFPKSYDQLRNAVNALLSEPEDLAYVAAKRTEVLDHIRKALEDFMKPERFLLKQL